MSSPSIDIYPLDPPPLSELASNLTTALQSTFRTLSINVSQPPDLTHTPYQLASPGLSGTPTILDIGGQPNLYPRPNLNAKYDLLSLAHATMPRTGSFLGAGAGPFHVLGQNSELATNFSWANHQPATTNNYYTKISNNIVSIERTASTDCALMMNLYGSEGQLGETLHVRATATSSISFSDTIRKALGECYERPVSIGGVFTIKGKAKFHVMPGFLDRDFTSAKDVNEWLTYHEFQGTDGEEIVCLSVLHGKDMGLGLRMEHTHCFGAGGGHYHHGIGEVEYEGWFGVAERVVRVDRPQVTLERDLHDDE